MSTRTSSNCTVATRTLGDGSHETRVPAVGAGGGAGDRPVPPVPLETILVSILEISPKTRIGEHDDGQVVGLEVGQRVVHLIETRRGPTKPGEHAGIGEQQAAAAGSPGFSAALRSHADNRRGCSRAARGIRHSRDSVMAYIETRLIHDADAHIMETPTWLRDHADPDIRDRIEPLESSGNELRQTGDPDEQLQDLVATFDRLAAKHASDDYRPTEAAEIMNRKNFAATGSFVPDDRPRALDLIGVASQLVFNTFHNRRLHDWEHAGDLDFAYGIARAHNRGMVEFCAVDQRLLPTCYVPLADFDRARRWPARRSPGCSRSPRGLRLPGGTLRPATSASTRSGPRPRRRGSRSSSTWAAPAT